MNRYESDLVLKLAILYRALISITGIRADVSVVLIDKLETEISDTLALLKKRGLGI